MLAPTIVESEECDNLTLHRHGNKSPYLGTPREHEIWGFKDSTPYWHEEPFYMPQKNQPNTNHMITKGFILY